MNETKKPVESRERPVAKASVQSYPDTQRAYEKLMQHDAHRRVKGRVRQTQWGGRS